MDDDRLATVGVSLNFEIKMPLEVARDIDEGSSDLLDGAVFGSDKPLGDLPLRELLQLTGSRITLRSEEASDE